MSFARRYPAGASRPKAAHPEDDLQQELVQFHARAVVQTEAVLFACPNGEKRDAITAARLTGMKAGIRDMLPDDCCLRPAGLGVLPGVADLILLLRAGRIVLVEVKIPKIMSPVGLPLFGGRAKPVQHRAGVQSVAQKRFQAGAEQLGHEYRVIRSVEAYADLLEEKGVRLLCRPWGPGVVSPRPPVGF